MNNKKASYYAAPGISGPGFGMITDRKILRIEELVCDTTGETPKSIKKRSRTRNRVLSRQMMFYFLRRYTNLMLVEMGQLYGLQDHSTVVRATAALKNLMFSDPAIKNQVEWIDNILKEDLIRLQ